MRKLLFTLLAAFPLAALALPESLDGNRSSSLYFGPNALPVPDMLDGTTSPRLYAEVAFDTFRGFHGDRTFDLFVKIHVPLFTPRVNLSVWMPVIEGYRNTSASLDHQQPMERRMRGREFGNVYVTTDIHVFKQKRLVPDVTLRVGLVTASGDSDEYGRYFDSPGYFVDASAAKSVVFKDGFFEELRFVLNAGFLCWQVGKVTQNDAFMYGGKVKLATRVFDTSLAVQGYSGWIGNGDRPCVLKAGVTVKARGFRPLVAYQYGFRDYPFHQFRVGLGYVF